MTQKRVFVDGDHGSILRSPPVTQANILSPTKHSIPTKANDLDPTVGRKKLHNIDLNNVYDDSEECMENLESSDAPVNVVTGSPGCPLWIHEDSHKSSSPQASENSGSTSTKSPSSSNAEAQDCSWFDSIPSIDQKWRGDTISGLGNGAQIDGKEDCFYDLPYNTGYQIFVLRLRKTRDEIMKCTLSIYVDIYFD